MTPRALTIWPQWCVWKKALRYGKLTKVPFQINGVEAKTNDPATWTTYEKALARFQRGGYLGVGYVFSSDDPFCGSFTKLP